MAKEIPRDMLQTYTPADKHHLAADEWNAVVRFIQKNPDLKTGYADGGLIVSNGTNAARSKFIQAWTADDIAPYSIFSIVQTRAEGAYSDDHPQIQVAPWGFGANPGSPLIMYTNGPVALKADTWGWVRAINMYEHSTITYNDVYGTPLIGDFIGPRPGSVSVELNRTGFIVLDVNSSAGTVVVQRTDEPHCLLGVISQKVTRYNTLTKELGYGRCKIRARTTADKLLPQTDMGGTVDSEWEIFVWNPCATIFAVGTRVELRNTLGIGLVVNSSCGIESSSVSSQGSSASSQGSSVGSDGSESVGSDGSDGSSAGSSGSGVCAQTLDDAPMVANLPAGGSYYMPVKDENGCLYWVLSNNCGGGSSGS